MLRNDLETRRAIEPPLYNPRSTRALRIAMVQRFLPSRSRGGVGHFAHGLSNALVRRGHSVTVFSQDPAPDGSLYQTVVLRSGCRVFGYSIDPLRFPFQVSHLDFSGFDLVHAQGDDHLIRTTRGVPVVRTMHGSALAEAFYNGWKLFSLKRLLLHLYFYLGELLSAARADGLVCDSKGTGRFYPGISSVIPNGFDLTLFSPNEARKSPKPAVLFVGELGARKRGRLLIDEFTRAVKPSVPEAELWLVSPETVEREGIRCFGGISSERLAELYRRAWVLCLPSSYEGFGRPYVEAMASGTAVVATNNPGAREVLEDGRYGLVTSEDRLGQALVRLLTSQELRRSYEQRGLERAKGYAWDRVAEQYEGVYREVLAKTRKRPRPDRILFLQPTSEIGGSDLSLLGMLECLDRAKFEAVVALPRHGPLTDDLRKLIRRVHIVPSMRKLTSRKGAGYLLRYALGFLPAAVRLAGLIRRQRIDLVHTNTIHNLYGFLAAKLTARPHIWHIREIVVQSALARWVEVRLARRFSDLVIAISDAVAEAFRRKDGSTPKNLVRLYNGIDLEKFHPGLSGRKIRAQLGIDGGTPLVGVVARLDPWKGIELFLEAAAKIHERVPSASFLVCGGEIEGHEGYEAELRRRAERLGLAAAVVFTGRFYRPVEIAEVLRALDVCVHCPVYPEPFGRVNVEAMACAVPIVTVADGGPREVCVHGETGLVVPPRDSGAIAEAVVRLLGDRERRLAMGKAGRKRAEMLFDQRQCVKTLEELYLRTLRQRT